MVAERIAAEEIAAKKAKTALGNTLAQAAQFEKAENAALHRQIAEMKEELVALKGANATAPSQSTPPPKAENTPDEGRKTAQREFTTPRTSGTAGAPSSNAGLTENLKLDGDHPVGPMPEAPLRQAARSSFRGGGHLTLALALFAAVLGWSLVIFDKPDPAEPASPPTGNLSPATVEATAGKAPPITKSVSPNGVQDKSVPKVTAVRVTPSPIASGQQTRSLQNERIEQNARAAKRAKKLRAVLQRRLADLRKHLTETEAKLVAAEQQADTARHQAKLANDALDKTTKQNRRLLDANAKASFRTEAKLMAEIKTLRKALTEARRGSAPLATEAE